MALSLRCPNCGGEVGIMDNNKEEFFYINEKGKPDCKHCDHYYAKKVDKFLIVLGIVTMIAVIIVSISMFF